MKAKLAALCLCVAMILGSLIVATPAKAVDTSNELVVEIRGAVNPPSFHVFEDVAWTTDGRYALFVGHDDMAMKGVAWWYDPTKTGDAAWTQAILLVGSPNAQTFLAVEWIPSGGGYFMILGDALSGYWYYISQPEQYLGEAHDAQLNIYVEDMAYVPGVGMYAVGRSGINGEVRLWNENTMDWLAPLGLSLASANWNACQYYSGRLYCAGSNSGASCLYGYYDLPNGPWSTQMTVPGLIFTDMVLDTFDYDRFILTTKSRSTTDAIWEAYGMDMGTCSSLATMTTTYDLHAIDIDSEGFAVAVGRDTGTGNGLVYDVWWTGDDTSVMKRSQAAPPYSGQTFKGVAIRPTGVQMAMIAGSAFKYSYTSVVGPIQVDTAVPHIDYVDVYPTGTGLASSVLNSQTDVDIGDSNTLYTLEFRVFDNLGIAHLQGAEIWLWHDAGGTVTDLPVVLGPAFDVAGGENIRMHFTITSLSAWSQVYPPVTGTEETTLIAGAWTVMDATSAIIVINFSPHQQVRAAAGAPGFTQPAGNRYGGGVSEGQSTLSALDTANTWDIKVRVADDAPTTNYASAYDEFGFYKYTYLGAANIPNGGAVYGSGAPGTNNVVMTQSGSDVTFCANCPYTLAVNINSNLIGVAVPANNINADQISVVGGSIAGETQFPSGGGPVTLIGPQAPLNAGRETTTSSWDGNAGTSEAIVWEVNIPGVPEDSYVSTITWSLTN